MVPALLPQDLEEADDGLDPAVEVRDVELLVGGVQVVVGEAEAHRQTDLAVGFLLPENRNEQHCEAIENTLHQNRANGSGHSDLTFVCNQVRTC